MKTSVHEATRVASTADLSRTLPIATLAPTVSGDRVLLVDDDGVARLLTSSALAARGWQVIEADGGAQAIALFDRERPDVVVLDALMPDIDGFATCEQLRRHHAGAHVPVLMLTGLDDERSIARAYEVGATDFFVKTTSQWTLLSERLRYLLRASRMRVELAESQANLSKAQRIARLGSWEWNIGRRWIKLSEECFGICGLPRHDQGLADWFLWTRVLEDERPRLVRAYQDALAGKGDIDLECRIARPDGQVRVVHIEAEIDRSEAGQPLVLHGVMQDITERKQAEDQIRRLANYDSLTGLPNRRFFRDQFLAALDSAHARGSLVALLFIDIDRFKQINDTLGHQVGDQLLREVARRLYQAVREGDMVARSGGDPLAALGAPSPLPIWAQMAPTNSVARLGGDEFTILLADVVDLAAVERVARRLLDALRLPVQCGAQEVFVTASIGVSVYPQHGADVDTLVRKADIAMYAVKDGGRNGWQLFHEGMNAATADRWRIENALHRALERQELVLHYQPKIDVHTGLIVGAEALMRWQRDGTLVPPGEFIAAAEETGLIVPITEWAIAETCRQVTDWCAKGAIPVPVSVNISSRHMQRANLAQPVQRALDDTGMAAGLLELELTETVLMHNIDQALPLLRALKQLGVAISIDDFGTGYSSLAYLRKLPIDTLKIDRSFVRDLEDSDDNAAIVAAIIAMSRSLKLRVVAEGVETEGQMNWLARQGCHVMQGWLFARAITATEFLPLLLRQDATGTPGIVPSLAGSTNSEPSGDRNAARPGRPAPDATVQSTGWTERRIARIV
jgi:predicted signal transduction protein with EAL and GGDEF domain/DNA-binding response OmpR family regulator